MLIQESLMLWKQNVCCSQETKNVATHKLFLQIHFSVMCEIIAEKKKKKKKRGKNNCKSYFYVMNLTVIWFCCSFREMCLH